MNQFETRIFESTVAAVKECFGLELTEADFAVETPRDKTLGDYAVSVAMHGCAPGIHQLQDEAGCSLFGDQSGPGCR